MLDQLAWKHFGEIPFLPENKEENLKLSKKQQELSVEFQMKASEIMNQYIKPEQRSFTIISYPIPEIGDNFEEIFKEVVKLIHWIKTNTDRFSNI